MIVDEKIAVTDTVDAHKVGEWLANLETALAGRKPDYLVIHHLEPDHAGGIADFVAKYPEATLVSSAKAFSLLPQFMTLPESVKMQTVKEGDTLSLGAHTLQFIGAPMVHWPEVLFSYEAKRVDCIFGAVFRRILDVDSVECNLIFAAANQVFDAALQFLL